jgi:gliding motility-associated-like protein
LVQIRKVHSYFHLDPGETFEKNISQFIPNQAYFITIDHGMRNTAADLSIWVNNNLLDLEEKFIPDDNNSLVLTLINSNLNHEIWLTLSYDMIDIEQRNKFSVLDTNYVNSSSNVSTEDLVRQYLIGGDCYDIDNIVFTGDTLMRGHFFNGELVFQMDEGIVLGCGQTNGMVTPGNQINGYTEPFIPSVYQIVMPDLDLNSLDTPTYHLSILEFDITPTTTPLSFNYVFGSDEYCIHIYSSFRDVFGFFISGPGIAGSKNIAVLPDGTPISIATLNHVLNSEYYVPNLGYGDFGELATEGCAGHPTPPLFEGITQFDGYTKVLTATSEVIPCQTYHIKLAIADVGDASIDSGVLVERGSFGSVGSVSAQVNYGVSGLQPVEGCDDVSWVVYRKTGKRSDAITVNYSVGGTATAGTDYTALPNPLVIPPFVDSLVIPITIFDDLLVENPESIVLTLENPCKCNNQIFEIEIRDPAPILVPLVDSKICFGESKTLNPIPQNNIGLTAFLWSNGSNKQMIALDSAGTYTVTVTDACGHSAFSSCELTVTDPFWVQIVANPITEESDTFQLTIETNLPDQLLGSVDWSPGLHISDSTIVNPLVWPIFTTEYYVNIISTDSCSEWASMLIEAPGTFVVFVPNVFSPNDDGKNDKLWIYGIATDIIGIQSFSIYDRWGNEVFYREGGQINDINLGWDGTFRATLAPTGVYGWQTTVIGYNNQLAHFKGDFTLLR